MKPIEVDGMPKEVATEYLTTLGAKMTNSFRRQCIAARANYYESDRTRKPVKEKLAGKFSHWTMQRLLRQRNRTHIRVARTQRRLDKIMVPWIKQALVNEVMVPLLQVGSAVDHEIKRREDHIKLFQAYNFRRANV